MVPRHRRRLKSSRLKALTITINNTNTNKTNTTNIINTTNTSTTTSTIITTTTTSTNSGTYGRVPSRCSFTCDKSRLRIAFQMNQLKVLQNQPQQLLAVAVLGIIRGPAETKQMNKKRRRG